MHLKNHNTYILQYSFDSERCLGIHCWIPASRHSVGKLAPACQAPNTCPSAISWLCPHWRLDRSPPYRFCSPLTLVAHFTQVFGVLSVCCLASPALKTDAPLAEEDTYSCGDIVTTLTSLSSSFTYCSSTQSNPTCGALLWCDLGFFPNSRGNKAAANLRPKHWCDHHTFLFAVTQFWTEFTQQLLRDALALRNCLYLSYYQTWGLSWGMAFAPLACNSATLLVNRL